MTKRALPALIDARTASEETGLPRSTVVRIMRRCDLVARRLGRHAIGIELNAEYLAIAAKRLQQLSLLGGAS